MKTKFQQSALSFDAPKQSPMMAYYKSIWTLDWPGLSHLINLNMAPATQVGELRASDLYGIHIHPGSEVQFTEETQ